MKKKKPIIIPLIIFVLCMAYLVYGAVDNAFATEEEKIIDEISTIDHEVSQLLLTKETDDGVFCLATSQDGNLIIASLKEDNDLFNRIFELGYKTKCWLSTDIDRVISNDPLKMRRVRFVNFDKRSCWFGYCTDERAKKLKINGEIIEADKVDIHVDNEEWELVLGAVHKVDKRDYSGYFWFYESVDKPTVELVG